MSGYLPARILHVWVRSPIEKAALLMVVKFVEAEAAAAGLFTLHYSVVTSANAKQVVVTGIEAE